MSRPLILITNDDGVHSPGLAALAAALDPLGDLLIVAPREQQSAMGRSMPVSNDGRMFKTTIRRDDRHWEAYGVTASPAQAVKHALLELADRQPSLVAVGINYGENIGFGVTASGTVGAALEGAGSGIPSLALSLQVDESLYFSHDESVDFSTAMHFSRLFAERWLESGPLEDAAVLKIDIPTAATPQTPWRVTHLLRQRYYQTLPPVRRSLEDEGRLGYTVNPQLAPEPESDAMVLHAGLVTVTPLTTNLTARIAPTRLRAALDGAGEHEQES
jgi:5'-nucleotidase